MNPPYPSYKNSGVNWLGPIPAHWKIGRLKFLASARTSPVDKHIKDDEIPVRLCNYIDVYNNEFINSDIDFMTATATTAEIERFKIKAGDVFITKDSESWNDIAVPAMVKEDFDDVLCGYHLSIIRSIPGIFHSGFLFRLLSSEMLNYQLKIEANGVTRFGLPAAAIDSALLLFPQMEEQVRISDFLDRETIRIDKLIEKKRRMLELLEEKRSSIVVAAVTKGLDPNVEMIESGFDWLGSVPKHWDLVQSKYALGKGDYGISDKLQRDGEFGVLTMADIGYGDVSVRDLSRIDSVDPGLLLRESDLIYNRTNSYEQVAKVGLFLGDNTQEITFASYLVRFRPLADVRYLKYLLNIPEFLAFARSHSFRAIGQVNLNPTRYVRLEICLPPRNEQKEIVDYLDKSDGVIRAQQDKINAAIVSVFESTVPHSSRTP